MVGAEHVGIDGMGVYESLDLEPIINASGPVTRLGGAPLPRTVLDAYQDAARGWVPLEQLQAAASKAIAQVTGTEAGLVTCGSAAALTLGTAAILARYDLAKMEQLPDCSSFPHEFVIAREHRNGYDHAVRAAGAKLVEVGFNEPVAGAGVRHAEAWEYEAAFGLNTAGVLYVYTTGARPPIEQVVACAHQHNLPVLVDAAGELPPRSNLLLASVTGADLVAFSGGKAIRGPQDTGILCGKRDLIASAALQMLDMDDEYELWDPPAELIDRSKFKGLPRHGIGRSMKVPKEDIVALMAALAMFANGDFLEDLQRQHEILQMIASNLDGAPATCRIIESADEERCPILEVVIAPQARSTAMEICCRLRRGSPPIYLGHGRLHDGILVVHPLCLSQEDADIVGQRLKVALTA